MPDGRERGAIWSSLRIISKKRFEAEKGHPEASTFNAGGVGCSQSQGILPSWGHLAMSGDIFHCHSCRRSCYWRTANKVPCRSSTAAPWQHNYSSQIVHNAEVKAPWGERCRGEGARSQSQRWRCWPETQSCFGTREADSEILMEKYVRLAWDKDKKKE